MAEEIVRELVDGEWVTHVKDVSGGGGSQTLAQTLALGNDANNLQITNVAEGTLGDDVATVSQLGEGLPTGWTQDGADPANVSSEDANLDLGTGALVAGPVQTTSVTVGDFFQPPQVLAGSSDPSAGRSAFRGTVYLRNNGQAWLKTGAGDTDWTQLGGVPAAAINVVRVPIAFDDAGLSPVTYAITAAAADPVNTFTVAGNHASEFVAGQRLNVVGSSNNDGTYHIVSAVFGAATVITVSEAVTDNTADGDITTLLGVVAYTPAVGDILLASFITVSVTTVWDGSGTPTLWLFQQGAPDYTNTLTPVSGVDLTSDDVDVSADFAGSLTNPRRFTSGTALPWNCLTTRPLRIGYDDGNYADPVSTQGEGEVVFVVQSA